MTGATNEWRQLRKPQSLLEQLHPVAGRFVVAHMDRRSRELCSEINILITSGSDLRA